MVDRDVVERRLRRLDETLAILRQLSRYERQEFLEDPERYGSAERFLQIAIETLADVGAHVIAELDLGTIQQYRDIPLVLHEHGYLDEKQRDAWARMAGFRNVLVHNYLDIDRTVVHDILRTKLADLESLRDAFTRWL